MHRREALSTLAGCLSFTIPDVASGFNTEPSKPKTGLGLVAYCSRYRRAWMKEKDRKFDLYQPQNYLDFCRQVGAGGMQVRLGEMDEPSAVALRKNAEQAGMFVEAIVTPPVTKRDLDRFDAEMRTAKQCGALAARTVIVPGRRYERFKTLREFDQFVERGRKMLELAAPIAEKHRVPLAVENHKDQRGDNRAKLLKQIGSEFVGACVDTGNSMALLEDPVETARHLAPFAFSVHLKDQAVADYADGFLLADASLGQGVIDLKRVVDILRKTKPKVRFSLELITRDPLKVPCLTERYWTVMPKLDARVLAGMMRTARIASAKSLPRVESLPLNKQLAQEDANVQASLDYAKQKLGL